MHYLIVATRRFMLAALILVGVGLFLLMGLLSIVRGLLAADDDQQPQLSHSNVTGGFRRASE